MSTFAEVSMKECTFDSSDVASMMHIANADEWGGRLDDQSSLLSVLSDKDHSDSLHGMTASVGAVVRVTA